MYHSRTFLKLPVTAQNLMTFLILNSDNNGIVMAYAVMRMINASDDDLRLLKERGFVYVLNEDLVTYIPGFQEFMNECEKLQWKPWGKNLYCSRVLSMDRPTHCIEIIFLAWKKIKISTVVEHSHDYYAVWPWKHIRISTVVGSTPSPFGMA